MSTFCIYRLPGCEKPAPPYVDGEPLVSHGCCTSCATAALAMARSDMARMWSKEAR